MADYPSAAPAFTPKVDSVDYPQAVDINELQEEITAIGTALVSGGLAHDLDPDATAGNRDLGSAAKTWRRVYATNLSARGIDYIWPAADGTASQALTTDGAGNLSWGAGTTNPVRVLNRDVAVATVTNTATETTVYSYSVTGGTLGSTKALRLTLIGDYLNDSGANRDITLRVKLGATTIFAGATTTSLAASANRRPVRLTCDISALNATNAQVAAGTMFVGNNIGVTGTGGVTGGGDLLGVHSAIAEDSTSALTLAVTAQLSTADATQTFRAHTVQLELLD